MRDQYNVQQAGAVGPGAQNFGQIWNQAGNTIDLTKLAEQLSALREALQQQSKQPQDAATVTAVASAEAEAKNGNGPKVLADLSKAGKWALDVATSLGKDIAAEAIKKSLGL